MNAQWYQDLVIQPIDFIFVDDNPTQPTVQNYKFGTVMPWYLLYAMVTRIQANWWTHMGPSQEADALGEEW